MTILSLKVLINVNFDSGQWGGPGQVITVLKLNHASNVALIVRDCSCIGSQTQIFVVIQICICQLMRILSKKKLQLSSWITDEQVNLQVASKSMTKESLFVCWRTQITFKSGPLVMLQVAPSLLSDRLITLMFCISPRVLLIRSRHLSFTGCW